MGYLYLLASVLCGNIKGFCGKKTSNLTKETSDAIFFNFIRMIFCIAIGFCLIFFQKGLNGVFVNKSTVLITFVAGITNSLFVVSWLFAVKYGMYMTVDVALTCGAVVPIILCSVVFGENVSPKQIVGLIILTVAVIIMCGYNKKQKGNVGLKSYLILFVCGLASGLTDFSQKLYVSVCEDINISVYNLYLYLFSAIFLGTLCLIFKSDGKKENFRKGGFYIFIMAVCLFGYSYFKTKAALFLPAVQIYPLSQSLSMIVSSFMASAFFKEKITPSCIFGICLSFIALLFINM